MTARDRNRPLRTSMNDVVRVKRGQPAFTKGVLTWDTRNLEPARTYLQNRSSWSSSPRDLWVQFDCITEMLLAFAQLLFGRPAGGDVRCDNDRGGWPTVVVKNKGNVNRAPDYRSVGADISLFNLERLGVCQMSGIDAAGALPIICISKFFERQALKFSRASLDQGTVCLVHHENPAIQLPMQDANLRAAKYRFQRISSRRRITTTQGGCNHLFVRCWQPYCMSRVVCEHFYGRQIPNGSELSLTATTHLRIWSPLPMGLSSG